MLKVYDCTLFLYYRKGEFNMDKLFKIISDDILKITEEEYKKAEKEIMIKELLEKHKENLEVSAGLKERKTLR